MLLRMSLITDCNSFAGPPMRLSISSSSGVIRLFISSNVASYLVTLHMVWAASGCLPMRSVLPCIGWNKIEKWEANAAPDTNKASGREDPMKYHGVEGFKKEGSHNVLESIDDSNEKGI